VSAPPDPAGPRPDAWDRIVDRMERKRQQAREYRQRPEVKARQSAYHRRYDAEHRAELRAYNREWMRQYRKAGPQDGRVGALHSLGCKGGHWRPWKRCRPIPCYSAVIHSV
jgi:hypothetical protein